MPAKRWGLIRASAAGGGSHAGECSVRTGGGAGTVREPRYAPRYGRPGGSPHRGGPRTLDAMRAPRQVVDYSLRKRALLREVYAGRVGTYEVCDASPYLISAARFHGEPTEERCPVCRRENLIHVHYVYGDELKQSAGQARTRAELPKLAMSVQEMQVYVVEVCRGCSWNHLVEQFLLGRSSPDPSTVLDDGSAGAGRGARTRRAAVREAAE